MEPPTGPDSVTVCVCVRLTAGHVQELQRLCCHLQDVLKQQNQLRQRLMKPLTRTNLPVQAHLHR